jgi:Bacterial SH3 domain
LKSLKVFLFVLLFAAGGAAYYYFAYLPAHQQVYEVAYILPSSVPVVDSRAEIHNVIGNLNCGDRVEVISKGDDWAEVRFAEGKKGWVESKDLMDSSVFDGGLRLLKDLAGIPVQAAGHTTFSVNLRLEPSRDGALLERLGRNKSLEIFGRRLVPRSAGGAELGSSESATPGSEKGVPGPATLDAWYLVRTDSRAGWVFGRLVTLDIPEGISTYAQNHNMVAWLVLNTVDDNGRRVPQYLVADRDGTLECDFNHIRVFTWWVKQGHYATAYVESNLNGYFPIRVAHSDTSPEFRLRLIDAKGRKFQKIYRLSDTVVRPLGTVEGWASDANPIAKASKPARRSR